MQGEAPGQAGREDLREHPAGGGEALLAARGQQSPGEGRRRPAHAETEARETIARAVSTLGLPIDIDPGKALLDEIHWTAGHVAWLRDEVQELEDNDLVWGKVLHREGVGPEGPMNLSDHKSAPNTWYQLNMAEREHPAKVCALALKAGTEERKVHYKAMLDTWRLGRPR